MPVPLPVLLRSAGLVGGVAGAALLVLVLGGWAEPVAGLVALTVVVATALLVARVWLGTLAGLESDLRAAAEGRPAPPRGPILPAAGRVAESAARLGRSLAEREALVGRLRRADTAIVEALPDPLLILDAGRDVLRGNAAARGFFGTGPDGTADSGAFLRHPRVAGAVDGALAEGVPQVAEVVLPVPMARDLSVQVIPLDPPLTDGGRLLVVLADRTQARAAERMRADFVANASHELRTPLASILGFVETVRGPAAEDAEARDRFLGIVADQAERMRRLVEDLLALSRIEAAEHRAPEGAARLDALAREEAEAMAPILAGRRATLEAALDAATAAPADAGQLAQVVRNLLENAVRYGREGGVVRLSVRALAAPEGALPPGVLLSVTDDGPGIAREHIPRLTERFYRVDAGRSRAAGGTGLGLAIVKHIVGHHRGRLMIDSAVGQGTTVRVWLPGH